MSEDSSSRVRGIVSAMSHMTTPKSAVKSRAPSDFQSESFSKEDARLPKGVLSGQIDVLVQLSRYI